MPFANKVKEVVIGKPQDPLHTDSPHVSDKRYNIALVAFLAWISLGADGLSSACYGPQEAFLALGRYTHLGLYLAVATFLTVFIIALAYNQVIELFPSGGGGYKIATQLLGSRAGLVSGSALLVDYVLTIAISIAAGVDALFSLLPIGAQPYKLITEIILGIGLIALNLRSMKESLQVLLPIFVGFILTHAGLIIYGIVTHAEGLPALIPDTLAETEQLTQQMGWIFAASLFLKAYSLGGGTYTGLEAVSNNVQLLREPRVTTGRYTMLYMAIALSFTAGGVILLYLLWNAQYIPYQTLNAVTFSAIIDSWRLDPALSHSMLAIVMLLETGLLFVAANIGFLGGPRVLAYMAVDSWAPRQFRNLSGRLVTQNGILLMGLGALGILAWTEGDVSVLVVLYSINVFITFSLSLLGLCKHWWTNRYDEKHYKSRLMLSLLGFTVTGGILIVTVVEKFTEGGWLTILITGLIITLCALIKRHYEEVRQQLRTVDALYAPRPDWGEDLPEPPLDPALPTAIFLVGKNRGLGMYTLKWLNEVFAGHFRNFIFLSVGEVDAESYGGKGALRSLKYQIENSLRYYVHYCHNQGWAATSYAAYGTDVESELEKLVVEVTSEYPNSVCLGSKLIFSHENWLISWLHNHTAIAMQRRLHLREIQMIVTPIKI
ncbi:MAG: APC family permease [Candidatus Competibacteraceae bacterium]|nr:APC family permease [Candidatus Competibacteraceae bacterium]MCP5127367.1 APC family permease [Gammaproteobacteria bacterium]